MKNLQLVIAVAAVSLFAWWLLPGTPRHSDIELMPRTAPASVSVSAPNASTAPEPEIPPPLRSIEADIARSVEAEVNAMLSQPLASTTNEPTRATENAITPWRTPDAYDPAPGFQLSPEVSEFEAIRFDSSSALVGIGERVEFLLPGGERVQAVVEQVQLHQNGDESWTGHLQGHGDQYPVAVTTGANSAFATITTPNGSYSMEAVRGAGWVYKNPSETELANPGHIDQVIPPDE